MLRTLRVALPVLALTACADPMGTPRGLPNSSQQPGDASLATSAPSSGAALQAAPGMGALIPGAYIVVLHEAPGLTRAAAVARSLGVAADAMRHEYVAALNGFAAELTDDQVARIGRDPRVAYVEPDRVVTVMTTQSPVTWGLDRIDQRALPLSNSYTYNRSAARVHAYIIDTGIRATHVEFVGRVGAGRDVIDNDSTPVDCNGHGTHVAGTLGGTTYGVAKRVKLHAVRVLSCAGTGSNAGVIAGVDWVRLNHVKPAVANMSLGGSPSAAVDQAVANAIAVGITITVAAGQSNSSACNFSPGRVASALTVASTTPSDARASSSNFGTCVDLFAPGTTITSAWHTSDTAIATLSGTSMAAPHVAGVGALYLAGNPAALPSAVAGALIANATSGVVSNPGVGSPNRLLFTNY